jgi:hypothetical protein
MKEFWNKLSAIAGIIAIAIALYVYYQDRNDKTQRIEITQISRTNLVNPELTKPSHRVDIFYNGKKMVDFTVLQFRIANVGGQPIRSTDYEVPIGLLLENVSEVLWAEQVNGNPSSLRITATIKNKLVEFSNSLLNPDDWFVIEVAVVPDTGKIPNAKPAGRVAGVKKIDYVSVAPSRSCELRLKEQRDFKSVLPFFILLIFLQLMLIRAMSLEK